MEIKVAKNYMNGEWVEIKGRQSQNVINPSTGETIGTLNLSNTDEWNAAIALAKSAFPEWRATRR